MIKFSDTFNSLTLDLTKWSPNMPWQAPNNGANGEAQMYDATCIRQVSGNLELCAIKPSANIKWGEGEHEYVSAMVHTLGKFEFTYGYVEATIKMPKGKGLWPAFWLLPVSKDWPPEIDIVEVLGHEPNKLYNTLHYKGVDGLARKFESSGFATDLSLGFNHFAINWQPNLLQWFFNGKMIAETTENVPNEPMYLLLNLAVGGYWPGWPDSSTKFPAKMIVQQVKVTQ